MFLKSLFLEGKSRFARIYKDNPPRYVMPFVGRIRCWINGDRNDNIHSAISYAWYVWEKGYNGRPEIVWINN